MTHKHFFRVSLFALIAVAAFAGCKKDPLGSVTGTLTVYDPTTPLVKTPVDSIKVYLINMDFKQDTVNPENNRAALIDSTFTDAAGKYSFTALPEGKYAIAPVFTKQNYFFVPENAGKDPSFSITADGTAHEINFTAPIPDSNNDGQYFHMTIKSVNRPAGGFIILKRQYWYLFVPTYYEKAKFEGDSGLYEDVYGETGIMLTNPNAWFLETYVCVEFPNHTYTTTVGKSYWLHWELFNMPAKSTVTIDWATETMTVVEGQ